MMPLDDQAAPGIVNSNGGLLLRTVYEYIINIYRQLSQLSYKSNYLERSLLRLCTWYDGLSDLICDSYDSVAQIITP